MKKILPLLLIVLLMNCTEEKEMQQENASFYVGTYTNKESKGIYKYELSSAGKLKKVRLEATVKNPSFLAKSKDKKVLFAVGETDVNGTGFIRSYKIEKDTLVLISKQETGGANPCFVAVNNENYVLAANYTGGNVGLLKADINGKLDTIWYTQNHFGKGTTSRQEAPHAHSAWFHPAKEEVIAVDLGTNELWFSRINKNEKKLAYIPQQKLKMPVGSGPRHLTFHPNKKWIYVLNELSNTVSLVKEKEGKYYVASTLSSLPKVFTAFSKAADIHISDDGKFVYASNRGHESIAIFKVNPTDGSLTILGYESVKGVHPRNFSLSPDNKFLLVANRDTNNIVSFQRNAETGLLTFVDEIKAPTPVCILF